MLVAFGFEQVCNQRPLIFLFSHSITNNLLILSSKENLLLINSIFVFCLVMVSFLEIFFSELQDLQCEIQIVITLRLSRMAHHHDDQRSLPLTGSLRYKSGSNCILSQIKRICSIHQPRSWSGSSGRLALSFSEQSKKDAFPPILVAFRGSRPDMAFDEFAQNVGTIFPAFPAIVSFLTLHIDGQRKEKCHPRWTQSGRNQSHGMGQLPGKFLG